MREILLQLHADEKLHATKDNGIIKEDKNEIFLQERLDYIFRTEKGLIPKGTLFKTSRIIAGGDSGVVLRVAEKLQKNYGGNQKDWLKKVGLIELDKYKFDVH